MRQSKERYEAHLIALQAKVESRMEELCKALLNFDNAQVFEYAGMTALDIVNCLRKSVHESTASKVNY